MDSISKDIVNSLPIGNTPKEVFDKVHNKAIISYENKDTKSAYDKERDKKIEDLEYDVGMLSITVEELENKIRNIERFVLSNKENCERHKTNNKYIRMSKSSDSSTRNESKILTAKEIQDMLNSDDY